MTGAAKKIAWVAAAVLFFCGCSGGGDSKPTGDPDRRKTKITFTEEMLR